MKRKYLDDIGVRNRWDTWNYNVSNMRKLEEQRAEYSFDKRETFSLDHTFYLWLYERLMMYMEYADKIVDFESEQAKHWEWKGQIYNQKQLIEICLHNLKEYLMFSEDETSYIKTHWDTYNLQYNPESPYEHYKVVENDLDEKVHEAAEIFVMMLPAMWW